MKLRAPWLIRSVALVASWLIRLWMNSLRYRILYADGVTHPADHRKQRYLYAFWHEFMLLPTTFRAQVHVLTSQHADAELITQVGQFLNFRFVRGSTTRGGIGALLELARLSRQSHLAVTPDGPRGPRRRLQPGLVYLASVTGLPVVVVGIGYSSAWQARSWDRFAVPCPGSTAACVFAPAINVPPRLRRDGLEQYARLIEERFELATAAAESWARSGPRPVGLAWNELPELKASA